MSDGGHRTSTIARPQRADATASSRRSPTGGRVTVPRSRGDLTTPIPRDKQLARARSSKAVMWLVGGVVVAALAAALFVLPVRAWLRQRDDLGDRQAQLEVLEQANIRLQNEVDRLSTPEGVQEAARDELGYVLPGEQRVSLTPLPSPPAALPAGWPYDQVSQIIAVRSAEAQQTAADPSGGDDDMNGG